MVVVYFWVDLVWLGGFNDVVDCGEGGLGSGRVGVVFIGVGLFC